LISERSCSLQCSRIDALVVNHGIWLKNFSFIHDLTIEQWDRTVTVNLRAAYLCSKYSFNNLKQKPDEYASLVFSAQLLGFLVKQDIVMWLPRKLD
ncbi:MAG: SDR family NAD(P)-dependent oxidoreductase, partial [Candidatus Hodarchaeota archaeon]